MIIEINSSNIKLSKATVKTIEKKAMKLSRFGEKISKVDIFLSEEIPLSKKIKVVRFGWTSLETHCLHKRRLQVLKQLSLP